MAEVIRDAPLGGDPVLLRAGAPAVMPAARVLSPAAISRPPARGPLNGAAAPAVVPAPVLSVPRADDRAERERELREELQAERSRVLEQARQAGHAAGMEAGRAEWSARIEELDRVIAAVHGGIEAGLADAEDVIVELAFECVAKLIGQIAPGRDGVLALVAEALAATREHEGLVLRLARHDVAIVEAARASLQQTAKLRTLEIVADDRIELGGCLIETAGGGLDARLETQLARLRDVLLAARQAAGGTP